MDCLIDLLSNENLLTIFEYLDAKTLKNAALVCTKWNDIISHSISTIRKFKILVQQFENYDNIMRVNRTVYTLAVQFQMDLDFPIVAEKPSNENPLTVEMKVKMLSDICSRHGRNIRIFYIYNGQFHDPKQFHNLLESMPVLEKLNAQKINLHFEDSEASVQPVVMKRLKKLQVSMTGFHFRYLLGSQPRELSLINLQREKMVFLNEFVETLEKLEFLTLSGGVAINMFLQPNTTNFHFKLKKLDIDVSKHTEEANDIYIINFLRSQTSSLEELSLRDVSSEILKATLTSLQFLKILKIYSFSIGIEDESFPVEKQFYDSLQPSTNLKELRIDGVLQSEIAAKGILTKCPELVNLVVKRYWAFSKIISFVAVSNPKIKHLELHQLSAEIGSEVKFKFLKNLHLATIVEDDVDNVTSFLKNNPTIEKLIVARSYINYSLSLSYLVHTLTNMPNLKYLAFECIADVLKVIYDGFVTSENKRPITLELIFDRMGMGSPRVRFQFPEDAGQWETKCAFVKKFVRTPHTDFMYRISH